jgi:glycosyltransferase involved in cell wall biosynthesis
VQPDTSAALVTALADVCADTDRALAELRRIRARHAEVLQDSAAVLSHTAAIRTSNTWRMLEAYRRMRIRLGISGGSAPALHAMLRAKRPTRRVPAAVRTATPGVNVAGYLDAESGLGEAARASIRSLEAAGIPVALNNVPSLLRTHDTTYAERFGETNPHPFNLVHLNADNMGWFAARRGRRYFRNRYTIGFWFWELSTFRDEWLPFFGYVDEVWAATEFVRAAIQAKTALPVVRMPLPIVLPEPAPHGRAHFGIPGTGAVFLYMFDISSQAERKHPFGAIRAFRAANLRPGQATLVLKFTNAEYDRAAVRRLHEEAEGLNVVMLDGYLSRPELTALLQASDCYLSPHRSEGFGMTLLEAMALGKPVIATNYSANVDFMTPENSYPLDYRLVPLTRDYGPYMRGAEWADPDLDHAGRLIRAVVEHPDEAAARGARAREDVARDWSPAVTGARVRERLEAIRAGRVHPQ